MAWTSPKTWVAGSPLSAAELNTHLRDNMLETAPGKAGAGGVGFIVSDGINSVRQSNPQLSDIGTSDTRSSSTFGDLDTSFGPSVEVNVAGTRALVWFAARLTVNVAGAEGRMSYEISGATSDSASNVTGIRTLHSAANDPWRVSMFDVATGLNPGNNTFTCKYAATAGTVNAAHRILYVLPL